MLSNKRKLGLKIDQMKEFFKSKFVVLVTGIIIILVIVSITSLKKTSAANLDFQGTRDDLSSRLEAQKEKKGQLEEDIKKLKDKQKLLLSKQDKVEADKVKKEQINTEVNSLIEENREISFKRLDEYAKLKTTDLTKKDLFTTLSLVLDKQVTDKDFKAITDSHNIEGFLKGKDNNYFIRKIYGDIYQIVIETKTDDTLTNVYVVNTKTKKIELSKNYQDIKVDIDEDY